MEREGLSSSREKNRKDNNNGKVRGMVERSEGWWSDEVERLIDARKVACRKLRGARKRGEEEGTLRQL